MWYGAGCYIKIKASNNFKLPCFCGLFRMLIVQICQESRNCDSLWKKYGIEMADLQLWKMKSLTLGLCASKRDRDLFKVKSYFLRIQLSQNFTFTFSGLALSSFRRSFMVKPKQAHPFLTWKVPPRRQSPSQPPADPCSEDAQAGAEED